MTDECGEASTKLKSREYYAQMSGYSRAGVDFIAIPCNSVHYFLPLMRKTVHIPILSIVEETAKTIKKKGLANVLLLATEFTVTR